MSKINTDEIREAAATTSPSDREWWRNQLYVTLNEIDRLEQWVNDLHSGMYINCVYCGHRYGPNKTTPVAMADVLKEHIEKCPDHPLSKARAEIDRLEDEVAYLRGKYVTTPTGDSHEQS